MFSSTIGQSKKNQPTASEPTFGKGVIKIAAGTVLGVGLLASAAIAGGLVGLAISFRNLPDVRSLKTYVPAQTSYVYDVKGRELLSLHDEANRKIVSLDQISPDLKRAVMAIEDSNFYTHQGINPNSIGRAILANFKSGGVSEGASTLTMHLVKNIFLSKKRVVTRKIAEAVLAIRVEQIFDKDQILSMYLNNIYWGNNNYGIQTASETYFKKPASKLNLAESAMLAGMIQAPEDYNPFRNFKAAKERQEVVLDRMQYLGWITPAEAEAAKKTKITLGEPTAWKGSKLPYVTDTVIKEIKDRFFLL